jgi:hypothetical protein
MNFRSGLGSQISYHFHLVSFLVLIGAKSKAKKKIGILRDGQNPKNVTHLSSCLKQCV